MGTDRIEVQIAIVPLRSVISHSSSCSLFLFLFWNSTEEFHDARGGWRCSDDRLKLQLVGILMETEPGNPWEMEGVLIPPTLVALTEWAGKILSE